MASQLDGRARGDSARALLSRRRERAVVERRDFLGEVRQTFDRRELPVEVEHELVGRSGHAHRATIYLPKTETVVEPIEGHWNRVTAAYAEFGDLQSANGYRLYSLLDDRKETPHDDVSRLLAQVSDVVEWSRREEWLGSLS